MLTLAVTMATAGLLRIYDHVILVVTSQHLGSLKSHHEKAQDSQTRNPIPAGPKSEIYFKPDGVQKVQGGPIPVISRVISPENSQKIVDKWGYNLTDPTYRSYSSI